MTTKVVPFFFRYVERIDSSKRNLFFVDVVRVYQVLYHLYKPFRLEFRKANGLDPVSIRNSGGLRGFKTCEEEEEGERGGGGGMEGWRRRRRGEGIEGFERALTPERRHLSLGR